MADADSLITNAALVKNVVDCLRTGGVVLLATDTVYGLAAMPDDPIAVKKLYDLKLRPGSRPLPVMVSGQDQIESMGVIINDQVERLLASEFIPGPLTIVAGLKANACPDWLAGRDEVAVRMPDNAFLLEVMGKTGPLLVTSANRHGTPTAMNVADVLQQLNGKPDLVVEGSVTSDIPSTLVNCRHNPVVIERSGAVPVLEISKLVTVKDG